MEGYICDTREQSKKEDIWKGTFATQENRVRKKIYGRVHLRYKTTDSKKEVIWKGTFATQENRVRKRYMEGYIRKDG